MLDSVSRDNSISLSKADSVERSPIRTSLIIVNHNYIDLLERALESVFKQSENSFEIIVVDNASSDNSIPVLEKKYAGLIKLIKNKSNLGYPGGVNEAIKVARGDYIAILNNDIILSDNWHREIVLATERHKDCYMFASKIYSMTFDNVIDSTGLLIFPDGICRCRGWLESNGGQFDKEEEVLCPCGAVAVYRRSLFDKVGAMDDFFFAYLEDLDLGLRAQHHGLKCMYIPSAIAFHLKSSTNGKHSRFKAFYVERNRIWVLFKNFPVLQIAMSPFYTLFRYILQGYAAVTYKGISGEFVRNYSKMELIVILVRAYYSAAINLYPILKKRKSMGIKSEALEERYRRILKVNRLRYFDIAFKD